MTVRTFAFNKLIRDKMYNSITSKGAEIKLAEIKTKSDLIKCFKKKLLEEVGEVDEAQNDLDLLEELADCVEVIKGFVKNLDVSEDDFEKIRDKKFQTRGGFYTPVMVENISISSATADPEYYKFFIDYCMKASAKYPEITNIIQKESV